MATGDRRADVGGPSASSLRGEVLARRLERTGDYYELWFVGPGYSPETPTGSRRKCSIPTTAGRSRVEFTAAVDPAEHPVLTVTAEAGDGNPARTGPEVLRLDWRGR